MKFNFLKKRPRGDTVNLAGGEAFLETPKMELASLMLTSMLEDQFYRRADATARRLRQLIAQQPDKRFVAKTALFARKEAGMRSVTHLAAAELANSVKSESWTARFYDRVVHRPDDVMEILACYHGTHGKIIPNSLKKGLGRALARFDEYQLAKYRKKTADISLVDAVNLVHPPATEALGKLVKGTLASAETWETKLTQAGSTAASEIELSALKREAWSDLIRTRKIGYFALLRNLRNILQAFSAPVCSPFDVLDKLEVQAAESDDVIDAALAMLRDEKLIRKSLVMPFRFQTTVEAIKSADLARAADVLAALSDAVDMSLANVPTFPGRTLIALDDSGSMIGRPLKTGSLFAAALVKANDADLITFSESARYVTLNKRDSTLTLASTLEGMAQARGTDFHCIFRTANRAYDRIIILSDMQGWIGHMAPTDTFNQWKSLYRSNPKVFSFDLQGYGTLQLPERNVFCLAGFSDKTMDTLAHLDHDPAALIRQIEEIDL
ncbi:MAG: TROVE domain-containing protein [Verrucomicrobiaceae bacterium]|nr:TROVE domain-containing protein [Verrucomicrobiaceae bacterium]